MTRQVPLKAMKAFEAVVRNGGFSRAANELNVTQSAVSHQVSALEAWVGRPLFDRTGPRPRVLKHGEAFAGALTTAFAAIDTACEQVRVPAISDRALTIAVIPSVATCWLIPRLSAFSTIHPQINLRIMYAIHGQSIDFGDADLAITYAKQKPAIPGSVATELLGGASAPVCSRTHFDAHAPFDRPEQIIAGGLLHDTDTSGWAKWLSIAGSHDVTPPDGPIYEDFNLLRAAALAGQGTALCPLSVIADDLRERRLCLLSHQTIYEDSAYYLVEPREPGRDRSAIHAFRQWILTRAELEPSGAGDRKQ